MASLRRGEGSWVLKLIALMISIAIWFYLKNQPQLEELRISYEVIKLPVVASFSDQLLTGKCYVEISPRYVDVALKGRYAAIKKLSKENVKAYVEIPNEACNLPEGEAFYGEVKIILPQGVDLINIRPRKVKVKIYPLVHRTFQVKLKFIGQPAKSLRLMSYVLDRTKVEVYGRREDIAKVKEVVATVSLEGLEFSTRIKVPLVALDFEGNPIDEVLIDPPTVTVSVYLAR